MNYNNLLLYSGKFISSFNVFLPSILALANILFISNTCNTITAQNAKIIDLLLASKHEVSAKVIPALPDSVILNQETTIWNSILPCAVFIGSALIFGAVLYFYYSSNSSGPSPNFPSVGTKKIEEVINEKSTEILESISQKSNEVISVVVEKTANHPSENFIIVGFKHILGTISEQMKGNSSEMVKVISKVTDDSNSATIDLIDSLTTDLGKKIDSNHLEVSTLYSSLSAQINELKQLIINSIGS